jgi:putative salt-induced outer membrane protein YdiY
LAEKLKVQTCLKKGVLSVLCTFHIKYIKKMIQKLSLAIFSLLLFSSIVIAEEAAVKEAAAEEEKQAEDELLKLETTVGESSDDSKPTETDKAAKDEESSKPWLPAAKEFDWVQLTSGEWLKGEIKSMYNDSLEFDSDKLDLLNIDWEDVKYLKSYRPSNVNIENSEPLTGSLQISGDKVTITNGDKVQEFDRLDLISLTPSGDREADLWTIKFTLGLNVRSGNTDQLDYNSRFNARRRTARSRFTLDYIGNISKTGNDEGVLTETINNNRISASTNRYVTRNFFYTPLFAEYYRDPFQNIDQRITAGIGLGYTIFNNGKYEWNVNGGPAYVSTKFISVLPGEEQKVEAGAMVFGTDFDAELTSNLDFIFKYNIQAAKEEAGGYTHHIITTFESEITGSLDFDISLIWDRISQPATDADGITPEPDDYRLTVGVTYTY